MPHNPILRLKRAYLATRKAMDESLADYNLTAAQFDILLYLWEQDGETQRAIQEYLGVTSGTLSGLVDSLVAAGYLEQRLNEADTRVKQLFLTPRAWKLREELDGVSQQFFSQFFDGFSPTEAALLIEWLGRVAANMGGKEA
jgi:DNA-binding MarR family transcriptional regulator